MKLGSPKRRQMLKARWLASRPAAVPVWADLSRPERLDLIRNAFKAEVSAKTLAEWLGITRSVVLGYAWKRGLLPSNADIWTPAKGREVVAARGKYVRKPRVPQTPEATRAKKRARLPNLAKNLPSYQAIDKFNALNCTDADIADELQVAARSVSIWRMGQRPVPSYILPLVDEVVAKLGSRA